jgi:hypothetical protein
MKYSIYFGLLALSTIKFLFAPFGGPALKLNFFETYFSCIIGAIVSSTFFFFLAEYFLKRSFNKKRVAILNAEKNGIILPRKKVFTKMNKSLIKVKHKLGVFGISFLAPLFLSIPVGTIIVAKFYGKYKFSYPLIILGIFVNGIITTGISYLIASAV